MAVAAKSWTSSYGRYVRFRVIAQEVEVDVPNNRSKVRVTGQIYYEGGTTASNYYPQTYTVTVNGTQIGKQTGITYSISSGGTKSLTTYTSGWINHGSNGAKTVTVKGHITDSAGDTGSISQSYALTTIARASTLNSFSMPNHLRPGTKTSFNLGITRRSSSFTHYIQLRDGSTVIASWTGEGTPTLLELTATQVNTLLNRMSSSTSRTMTLRVQTKSGDTNIGGALTRTATAYVHSGVTPNVSALSVTIEGNAHAKSTVQRFVQNISKVSGKFTRTATGGASIKSSLLEIRRKSGGSDYQSINSNSGTFSKVISLSGPYEARGTATDSRGRSSSTGWVSLSNFDVLAYSAPYITDLKTTRRTGTETTVDIRRYGQHSPLSGNNKLTIRLQKRTSGTTTWTDVAPDVVTSNAGFGATIPSTGHSVALSYDFRLYIVDQFGNSAERISTVSTQRVVLDIHKNEGVGIGKIREQGVLDVDGSAYFKGDLYVNSVNQSRLQSFSAVIAELGITPTDTISFWQSLPQGKYFVATGQIPGQPNNWGVLDHMTQAYGSSSDYNTIWYSQASGTVYRKSGNQGSMTGWVVMNSPKHGSNENGDWLRFDDGTQICYGANTANLNVQETGGVIGTGWRRSVSRTITYPVSFVGHQRVFLTRLTSEGVTINFYPSVYTRTETNFSFFLSGPASTASVRNGIFWVSIGRWIL